MQVCQVYTPSYPGLQKGESANKMSQSVRRISRWQISELERATRSDGSRTCVDRISRRSLGGRKNSYA